MAKVRKNLTGTTGDDELFAEIGNLKILGGYGNDIMHASSTTESFYGGKGDDTAFSYAGNEGNVEFFGGEGFDTFVTEGSILDYSVSQGIFKGTTSNKWNIVNNNTDSVSALKDVEQVTFGNYELYLDGRNNTPYAEDASVNALEDTPLNGGLTDHVWDLEDTLIFEEASVTTGTGATVQVNADGSYIYTPYENYSGSDSFEYTVTDGVNDPITRTVTVDIEAVADVPTLSVNIEEGEAINEAKLVITSALTDTDGSESLQLVISGIPAGVILTNATMDPNNNNNWIITDHSEDVILSWDKESDLDIDPIVTAIATEASNGDSAEMSITTPIEYAATTTEYSYTFTAQDQNIWGGGEAIVISDETFIGIAANSEYFDYRLGLDSDLEMEGGSVDAELTYDFEFTTYHNYATDSMLIDSDYISQGGSFSTSSPTGSYDLDLVAEVGVDISFGSVLGVDLGGIELDFDETVDLVSFDQDSSDTTVIGPLTLITVWPYIETSATGSDSSDLTADGRDDVLDLNLDVDDAVGYIIGFNPVHYEGNFSLLNASGSYDVELFDFDITGGIDLYQDFSLENDGISGELVLEDGSLLDLDFNEDILLHDVSSYDLDHDGYLSFDADLSVDADFTNNTDLVLDLGYHVLVGEASAKGSIDLWVTELEGEVHIGPLLEVSDSFDIASIDLYEQTFELAFMETEVLFWG